jgi:cytochrome c oxidase subunit 4
MSRLRVAVLVWALLVAMTAGSVALGHGLGDRRAATVVVLCAAFVKVLMVGECFMRLRSAPRWLRWGFAAWAVGMATTLVTMYLA